MTLTADRGATFIETRGVTRTYRPGLFAGAPPRTALDGVDLALADGERVALLGRSGSGKSTLGRLLLGLERPDAGAVLFRGRDVATLDRAGRRDFRRSVQVVFQDPVGAVDPRHRIGRAVAEPLRHLTALPAAARRARVGDLLEQVGLARSDADKLPGELSGGQLQRVSIARALAPEPRFVILDEAVSGLDLVVQAAIVDLLRDIGRDRGTGWLLVTHDLRLVRRLCDRVVVLDEGRIVEDAAVGAQPSLASAAGRQLAAAVLPARPDRRPRWHGDAATGVP